MTNNPLKNKTDNVAIEEVQVIERDSIRAIHSVTQDGVVHHLGTVRDFQWHNVLKGFLPSNKLLSFSWVHLKPGDSLAPHEHPMKGMIILTKGSVRLTGQKKMLLKEGDVVITPPFASHGFEAIEESHGLSIQFEEGIYTDPENARVEFLEDEKNV